MRDKYYKIVYDSLKGKNIPLVILDNKWHQLFVDDFKSKAMVNIEKKLNKTLQEQGKLNNDLKEYEFAKKKLMEGIINNMEEIPAENTKGLFRKEKKMDTSQKFILDINSKIEKAEKRLEDIPYEIRDLNNQLIAEGIRLCYDTIEKNQTDIDVINQWIDETHAELKKKLEHKQEAEESNKRMYTYVNNILGHDIIDEIDLNYEHKEEE